MLDRYRFSENNSPFLSAGYNIRYGSALYRHQYTATVFLYGQYGKSGFL